MDQRAPGAQCWRHFETEIRGHLYSPSVGARGDFTRPWMTPVPPLEESVEKVVEFPTEDESNGMILMGWRGPHVQEYYELAALDILMQYLTDTSAAPLQKELVEIEDPLCSDIPLTASHAEFHGNNHYEGKGVLSTLYLTFLPPSFLRFQKAAPPQIPVTISSNGSLFSELRMGV
eukprot:gene10840-19657_t